MAPTIMMKFLALYTVCVHFLFWDTTEVCEKTVGHSFQNCEKKTVPTKITVLG